MIIREVRKALQTALIAIHPRVYYEDAPDGADFPYLVYELEDSNFDGANTELFTLNVDGWDRPTAANNYSSIPLENLMDSVNRALEVLIAPINPRLGFRVVFDRRYSINDPDDRIKRRRYEYQIRLVRDRG